MSLLVYPSLPGLTLPILREAAFDTLTTTSPNKYRVALPQTVNPVWSWQLIYDFLRDQPTALSVVDSAVVFTVDNLRTLLDFFLFQSGSAGDFLFLDPDDNYVGPAMVGGLPNIPLAQLQVVTDGVNYYSPLQRTYGGLFYEDVTDLNTSSETGGSTARSPALAQALANTRSMARVLQFPAARSWACISIGAPPGPRPRSPRSSTSISAATLNPIRRIWKSSPRPTGPSAAARVRTARGTSRSSNRGPRRCRGAIPVHYSRRTVRYFAGGEPLDPVNHPAHYNFGKFEVIDVLMDWFPSNPLLWQVGKYIARSGHKGKPLEDLRKARFYLDAEIKRLETSPPEA